MGRGAGQGGLTPRPTPWGPEHGTFRLLPPLSRGVQADGWVHRPQCPRRQADFPALGQAPGTWGQGVAWMPSYFPRPLPEVSELSLGHSGLCLQATTVALCSH